MTTATSHAPRSWQEGLLDRRGTPSLKAALANRSHLLTLEV
jgi:hypothetical protein